MAFRHYGLSEKYVLVIKAFFDGTVSAVRHGGSSRGGLTLEAEPAKGTYRVSPSSMYFQGFIPASEGKRRGHIRFYLYFVTQVPRLLQLN